MPSSKNAPAQPMLMLAPSDAAIVLHGGRQHHCKRRDAFSTGGELFFKIHPLQKPEYSVLAGEDGNALESGPT